jgi:hypothetical protein
MARSCRRTEHLFLKIEFIGNIRLVAFLQIVREKDGVKFEYEYFKNVVNISYFYVKRHKKH